MCLPLGFLKAILIPSAIVYIICCIGYLICLITGIQTQEADYWLFILSYVLLLSISLLGLLGGLFEIRTLNIIYAAYQLYIAGVFIYMTYTFMKEVKNQCYEKDDIQEIALQTLCRESCPCQILPGTFSEAYIKINQLVVSETTNVKNYQSCVNHVDADYILLANQEIKKNCAGWCSKSPIFLFTDVNRGQPQYNCWEVSEHKISGTQGILIYTYGFLSMALLTLGFFSCCLICHPEQNPKQIYQYKKYNFKQHLKSEQDTGALNIQTIT